VGAAQGIGKVIALAMAIVAQNLSW